MRRPLVLAIFFFVFINSVAQNQKAATTDGYAVLLNLFKEWRQFESPPLNAGAPDYTLATREKRHPEFLKLQSRLQSIDTTGWQVAEKVDWTIVWSEMNGYDFNHRVLQPWVRDPAFYKSLWMARSDVPGHEGPTHHGTTELWTYTFPLTQAGRTRLLSNLAVIPALNEQAKENLTGNARELWIAGIRDIQDQSTNLENMLELQGLSEDAELKAAVQKAIIATEDLVVGYWPKPHPKKVPPGLGKTITAGIFRMYIWCR